MSNAQFPKIHSYEDAINYLGTKKERPCGNNTRIRKDGNSVFIRHFATDIVEYVSNGIIILDNGGYYTSTTKERLNAFIPQGFSIWQTKGVWSLSNRNLQISRNWKNGITILPDGRIENYAEENIEDKTKALTKQINNYAKKYVQEFLAGNIEKPSGGDCWYCSMKTESGDSLGDVTNNTDHLLAHLEEEYFVPSILMNICNMEGKLSQFNKSTIGIIWGYIDGEVSDWQTGILERDLKKQIVNYFKDRLEIAR